MGDRSRLAFRPASLDTAPEDQAQPLSSGELYHLWYPTHSTARARIHTSFAIAVDRRQTRDSWRLTSTVRVAGATVTRLRVGIRFEIRQGWDSSV
jgi:hypothetical protein